jgi:tRNA threonylcarbamoyladenosine biosynthesis protein TsaB
VLRDNHLRNVVLQKLPSPLLVLEASTSAGSAALFVDGALAAAREIIMGPAREDALLPAIAEMLRDAQLRARDIRNIACGSGPGSFTSLRIAASLAKGFAVANRAALFAVPSLLIAAARISDRPGRYVLHSDALRGERYALLAAVGDDGNISSSGVTTRMGITALDSFAKEERAVLVGMGAGIAGERDALVISPIASDVLALRSLWHTFGPVALASWEPDYGRVAEAQVKWETTHGHALPAH